MKRSLWLRLPFTALPLFAILTILRCRAAIRGNFSSGNPAAGIPKESFFNLASDDPSEAALRIDVDTLLSGKFPDYANLEYSRWRNHASDLLRQYNNSLALGIIDSDKDWWRRYPIFVELRRSLLKWWRKRRFQVEVMFELVGLVKHRLDQHAGRPITDHRYASCAVVGNSGILLKSDHGDLIDSHELVIRLNNARIHGYQRNVGSKTDLSFINSNMLHICARRYDCFCHPYGEIVPIIMYMCQAVHFLDHTICNSSHKSPLLITDIRFDVLCTRIVKHYSLKRFVETTGKPVEDWPKFHDSKMFHYSSGMQAVMLALGICDRVSVFGFGKSADAKHHYHTNQRSELDLHDYEAEYALYRDLAERPQVVPFLQDSGFNFPPFTFYH